MKRGAGSSQKVLFVSRFRKGESIVSRFISRVARVEDRQGRKLSKKERGERQENQCGRHAREAMKLVAECLTPFLSR